MRVCFLAESPRFPVPKRTNNPEPADATNVEARQARSDVIMAAGRSDYPNQGKPRTLFSTKTAPSSQTLATTDCRQASWARRAISPAMPT